jgi:tRNA pseudouridine13 synthase
LAIPYPLSPVPSSWPRAWGPAIATGRLKVQPEDFIVREWLGFAADGEGDHLLITVRKRGANTHWVARELARRAGVHPREVGFAGIKDRHAVTEQAFTVPGRNADPAEWLGYTGEGFAVIAASRQRRKLKRGAHKGNDFRIIVRDLDADREQLAERLALISGKGVPNYFGPQRFGRDGRNLDVAEQWFSTGRSPYDRMERGFALSAARAALFNNVLATRVSLGTWNRLQDGDVANLDGSGSVFPVATVDEVLRERCDRLDLHPTGPLPGRGDARTGAAIARLEDAAVAPWQHWVSGLAAAGLEHERRTLRLNVQGLTWNHAGTDLELAFRLGKGAFATTVLAEVIDPRSAAGVDDGEGD